MNDLCTIAQQSEKTLYAKRKNNRIGHVNFDAKFVDISRQHHERHEETSSTRPLLLNFESTLGRLKQTERSVAFHVEQNVQWSATARECFVVMV